MTPDQRTKLIQSYAEHLTDSMDTDTLITLAIEHITEGFTEHTDEQVTTEIQEMAPELLEAS